MARGATPSAHVIVVTGSGGELWPPGPVRLADPGRCVGAVGFTWCTTPGRVARCAGAVGDEGCFGVPGFVGLARRPSVVGLDVAVGRGTAAEATVGPSASALAGAVIPAAISAADVRVTPKRI